ncbi:MAG TPA: MarR family transcriptional regulator [Thermoanaerobaculia bacterium]|nr:MarR family transcriptional regulator [Thermoanaerobaculia bacterium]
MARFRHALRRFLRFSEAQARGVRISPNQYQLMLFIRGFPGPPPSIADLADRLQIQHQSAVGLVDRSARAGLVRRHADTDDRRRVRVVLTERGDRILARLVAAHARQFDRLSRALSGRRPPAKTR